MKYYDLIVQTVGTVAQSEDRPTSQQDLKDRVRHEALKVTFVHGFGDKLAARFVEHCWSYARDTIPTLTHSKVTHYALEGLKIAMGELENVRVGDLYHSALLVVEQDDVSAANIETVVSNMESRL